VLIFTAPKPLESGGQSLPIPLQTWKEHLKNIGTLVIFANDPLTAAVARECGIPLMCVEHTDENFPRFDLMMRRMHEAQTDGIVGFVNSDVEAEKIEDLLVYLKTLGKLNLIKTKKIFSAFEQTEESTKAWFAVANRHDISSNGDVTLHDAGGFDMWAWNRYPGGPPLVSVELPPFRFPLATYDNWLLDVVVQLGERNVIDGTETLKITHREHERVGGSTTWWEGLKSGPTGIYMNRYLGYKNIDGFNGSGDAPYYHWKGGTSSSAPRYTVYDNKGGIVLKEREIWTTATTTTAEIGCRDGNKTKCNNLAGEYEHETKLTSLRSGYWILLTLIPSCRY